MYLFEEYFVNKDQSFDGKEMNRCLALYDIFPTNSFASLDSEIFQEYFRASRVLNVKAGTWSLGRGSNKERKKEM